MCEHNKRKSRCKDCEGSEICEHKRIKSSCVDCGGSQICIHKRVKSRCKDCGGSQICQHNRNKPNCIECNGSQICEHKRAKSICKDCGGSSICEHKRVKSKCKDCGGSSFCEHNKRKSRCKDCGGVEICEHLRIKSNCVECGGSQICIHKRAKPICRECGGSQICSHDRIKSACFECKGGSICEHNKRRIYCVNCGGSQICEHKINKRLCKKCDGSLLCKTPLCETYKNPKKEYEGYCLRCFVYTFPDKPNVRNYKTKEKMVVDEMLKTFPNFTWHIDKKVQDGCSRRRPDLLLDMGTHIIIVEIDENQHANYDSMCENRRIMEISQDLEHRPIVFIRFNPDDYVDENNTKIYSCFCVNKTGIVQIEKTKQNEWNARMHSLKKQIEKWSNVSHPLQTIQCINLFYDSI